MSEVVSKGGFGLGASGILFLIILILILFPGWPYIGYGN